MEFPQKLSSCIENLIKCKMEGEFEHMDELPLHGGLYKFDKHSNFDHWFKGSDKTTRLNFIKLIAESRKSSLGFTKLELKLILQFLQFNIHEKMEFVPYIKKIIKRINENYLFLKRQLKNQEKTFEFERKNQTSADEFEEYNKEYIKTKENLELQMDNYKQACNDYLKFFSQTIRVSAVHYQNESSLQIIKLMQEFLSSEIYGNFNAELQNTIYETMMLNSYESNKQMCFEILSKCNRDCFKGKEDEMVGIAMTLAYSLKPIDSITSSLILKLVMLSTGFSQNMELMQIVKNRNIASSEYVEAFVILSIFTESLELQLEVAEESIILSASKYSLYGTLFCIRSILQTIDLRKITDYQEWRNVIKKSISLCFRLSKVAAAIVNNSSPEGHLPMDFNPKHLKKINLNQNDLEVTPQMVLLSSWRSVKEISLLFGELSKNAPIQDMHNEGLIFESEVEQIGEHFVKLLCETKHRGAFEQAHVGFGMLCSRMWRHQSVYLKMLPKIWLRELILEVSGLSGSNTKLCATRRSAGIPFMVQAIVTSELDRNQDPKNLIFHTVMKIFIDLSELADDACIEDVTDIISAHKLFKDVKLDEYEKYLDTKPISVSEIKSHALNILRTLVKNNKLGDLVHEYVADCLISAIKSYDGHCWAERNAATLLFSALVTRIFGVQRTKDHIKLSHHNTLAGSKFFEKYPKLLEFMIEELESFIEDSCMPIKPAVQSILLILSRLCPSQGSNNSDSNWKINDFTELISLCGKSRVYKTRELAARALVQFVTEKNIKEILKSLVWEAISDISSLNAVHGYCLQIIEVLQCDFCTSSKIPLTEMIQFFNSLNKEILHNLEISSPTKVVCYPLATAYIMVFQTFLKKYDSFTADEKRLSNYHLIPLMQTILRHTSFDCLKEGPGQEIYKENIIKLYMEKNYFFSKYCLQPLSVLQWKETICKGKENFQKVYLRLINESTKFSKIQYVCNHKFIYTMNMEDPELRTEVYIFLRKLVYACRTETDWSDSDWSIIHHISKWIEWIKQNKNENFLKCRGFFSLQKELYLTMLKYKHCSSLEVYPLKAIHNIYNDFYKNSWKANLNLDCKIEIAQAIQYLKVDFGTETLDLTFQWWTILLHLLLDNDEEVRETAATAVMNLGSIFSENVKACSEAALVSFFEKFKYLVCNFKPRFGTIVLFYWGTHLLHNDEFEMDDSDVFKKAQNYNYLDLEKLANFCIACIRSNCINKFSVSKENDMNYRECYKKYASSLQLPYTSFEELLYQYENYPVVDAKPSSILEPNYDEKLLCSRIYQKFRILHKW